jgi:exodeoxyribonuclease-3
MPFTVATWNINSVRLRVRLVTRFLRTYQPDILCLQEIKCISDNFPYAAFRRLGYRHIAVNGQRGYHGVAIISRLPFVAESQRSFCGKDDARHIAVTIADGDDKIELHDFYVPAGGDEPDVSVNEKFAHKLAFLDEMKGWLGASDPDRSAILVGDLNVAPMEQDVWSHKQLLRIVSHTPMETERLDAILAGGGWIDAARHFVPAEEKLYTWWSYRARDWQASDRGRRLDHIWVTEQLADRLTGVKIVRAARGWPRPSDHVPVIAKLATADERSAFDREQRLPDALELADRAGELLR